MTHFFLIPIFLFSLSAYSATNNFQEATNTNVIKIPTIENAPTGKEGAEIRYGFELLSSTAKFLGTKGSVRSIVNTRMSCRNCHMDVGRKPFGNSWLDTHANYPQYRSREGFVLSLAERTNNCFTHPMNGKPLPINSREMNAILLYYKWLGIGRPILAKDTDNRLVTLPFMARAADPKKGEVVYKANCIQCHGVNGQGKLVADNKSYLYPPLWGKESYQLGSSFSRISILARFIKVNMPYGATVEKPILTDEEAWDVSAFINSQIRPKWVGKLPFPHLYEKSFDFPIGPYADSFPDSQHKYGPYQPIIDYWQTNPQESDITKNLSRKSYRNYAFSKN